MKTFFFYPCLLGVLLIFSGCRQEQKTSKNSKIPPTEHPQSEQQEFAIAIHGGAGNIQRGQFSDSLEKAYKTKLKQAISKGYKVLKNGGTAVEAVQQTINILENSPLFNAGKGAVLTHNEHVSMDASIMNGKNLNAGAVAGVSHIKNPIDLAIAIMKKSKHVMLSNTGAEIFAVEQGFDTLPESYFITQRQLDNVRRVKKLKSNQTSMFYDPVLGAEKLGTVGCVALDRNGNLAAGTSTGGMTNKRYGRIGDSPIIGAGTYANNKTVAVSCTGWGEYYIRGVVAYDMSALMQYKDLSVGEASHMIIHKKQPELGGSGGMIAMDHYGHVSLDFNTPGMFRAQMDQEGNLKIAMYEKEEE